MIDHYAQPVEIENLISRLRREIQGIVYVAVTNCSTHAQVHSYCESGADGEKIGEAAKQLITPVTKQFKDIHRDSDLPVEIVYKIGNNNFVLRYIFNRQYLLTIVTDSSVIGVAWVLRILNQFD